MTRLAGYSGRATGLWVALLAGLAFLPAAWGQGVGGGAGLPGGGEEGTTLTTLTWQWIIESGGWVMYPLAAMSIMTVAFVVYFFVVLRAAQIAPLVLHREVIEKIQGGAADDARRACSYRPSPLAAVALAALDYIHAMPEPDPMLLKDVVEGEGARQAEAITGQIQYLLDIAVISPMLGLLGTVVGMLQAFNAVAMRIDNVKPIVLATGVSQALITTVFGLIVGIPAMMFYAYFRRRASRMVSRLEMAGTDVLTAILSRRQREKQGL